MIDARLRHEPINRLKIPLIWLYPILWLYSVIQSWLRPPVYKRGIHCISGDTGAGKTLLAHLVTKKFKKKGIPIISNSAFSPHVKVIDIEDYFDDYEQKKPLENCIVVFDEIQRQFNKRQNRKNDYNAVFLPLIEWLTTHRHNGVIIVYFLTQSYNQLDIQLQNLIHRVEFVFSAPKPDFKIWLRDKKFRVLSRPKKVWYYSKRKKDIDQGDIQKYIMSSEKRVHNKYVNWRGKQIYKKTPKYYEPVSLADLETFNTYAFKRRMIEKKPDEPKQTE